ncbi:MAG: DMT family transporter [Thermotaleaceae bacterium]
MTNQLKADLMMIVVTLFWGSSYLFMKMGLDSLQEYNLIALRFGIAFIIAALIFSKRLLKIDLTTIRYAFILGSLLFLVFTAITFGVKSTTTSNAGFLVSLAVIFVPLLTSILYRKVPPRELIIASLLAITGIGLLTLTSGLAIHQGDLLCILGAFLYAVYIVVTGVLTKNVDSLSLGIVQLGFTSLWGLLFSWIFEIPKLPNTYNSWIAVLGLGILCSAIGFTAQAVAQQYTTATHTGLIFSLEPVFAASFAFFFTGEILTPKGYLGAVLVLLGVLSAEVNFIKHIHSIPLLWSCKKLKKAE